jgi:hypothetical protein
VTSVSVPPLEYTVTVFWIVMSLGPVLRHGDVCAWTTSVALAATSLFDSGMSSSAP